MLQSTAIPVRHSAYLQIFYQENVNGTYSVFLQKDQYLLKVSESDALIGAILTHPYYLTFDEAENVLQQFKYNMTCGPCNGNSDKLKDLFPDFF